MQAALKVVAEMQRIPMPSPRKAGTLQPESPAGSEENAGGGGDSSPGFQERERICPHSEGASQDAACRALQQHWLFDKVL